MKFRENFVASRQLQNIMYLYLLYSTAAAAFSVLALGTGSLPCTLCTNSNAYCSVHACCSSGILSMALCVCTIHAPT